MSDNKPKDTTDSNHETGKSGKPNSKDQGDCFDKCKDKLENISHHLISNKLDKIRNNLYFFTFLLACLGVPGLGFYVKYTTDNAIEKKVAQYEEKIRKQMIELEAEITAARLLSERLIGQLSEYHKKLILELAKSNDFSSVKNILRLHKVDPNIYDDEGKCLLYYAALSKDNELVDELLKRNADIDCAGMPEDNKTPLLAVLESLSWEMAEKLIEKGAKLDFTDKDGTAPIHYAITHNQRKILKKMIEKGADLTLISYGKAAATPLIEAVRSNNLEFVKLICSKIQKDLINTKNDNQQNALIVAIDESFIEIAQFLIKNGADKKIAYNYQDYRNKDEAKKMLDKMNQ
jgi:ankyrin repeat protein